MSRSAPSPARSSSGAVVFALALLAAPVTAEPLEVSAFVDVYAALNANMPASGDSFVPGIGTSGKRANELSLNLAALSIASAPAPVGGALQLVVGNGTEVLHGGEPAGAFYGPDTWRPIYEAYLSVAPPVAPGLVVSAGVFSSHLGLESFFTKENWSYTRSWLAELSPWYQTGVRAAYTPPGLERLRAELHVVNGWQLIVDNNRGKSLGVSLGWRSDAVTAVANGWAGPERPGDDDHLRVLGDVVFGIRPRRWLEVAACVDVGMEQRPAGDARWFGVASYARVSPGDALAFSGRVEHVDDLEAGLSGTRQRLTEATVTAEVRPLEDALVVKLEGRFDHSTAPVFATRERTTRGAPAFAHTQPLVLVGLVGAL